MGAVTAVVGVVTETKRVFPADGARSVQESRRRIRRQMSHSDAVSRQRNVSDGG